MHVMCAMGMVGRVGSALSQPAVLRMQASVDALRDALSPLQPRQGQAERDEQSIRLLRLLLETRHPDIGRPPSSSGGIDWQHMILSP